jgi:hypothetical protein
MKVEMKNGPLRLPGLKDRGAAKFESDAAFGCVGRALYIFDLFGQDGYHRSVLFLGDFKLAYAPGKVLVGGQHISKPNKCANYQNVHLHGAVAAKHRGEHCHTMLGEGKTACSAGHPNLRLQFAISSL